MQIYPTRSLTMEMDQILSLHAVKQIFLQETDNFAKITKKKSQKILILKS